MNYTYGTGATDVNDFFRIKRSWSKVKDKILTITLIAISRLYTASSVRF